MALKSGNYASGGVTKRSFNAETTAINLAAAFQVSAISSDFMRMSSASKSLGILVGLVLATDALAVAGGTLLLGQRSADFHRFTGGRGHEIATGTDFTLDLYADPFKGLPLGLGLFYSSQSYNVSGDDHLFDEATVTEMGPALQVWTTRSNEKFRGFVRYAHTLIGTFSGKVQADRTMETGGGETTYDSGSQWQADLTGPHFTAGLMIGNESAGAGLAIDMGFQRSKLKKVEALGEDQTDDYAPYMKTDSDFQSTALMIAVQVRK